MSGAVEPFKIVICGPSRTGKTCISNLIAGNTEVIGNANETYDPTIGVRILECERVPGVSGRKVPIEIWDVGGDQSLEGTWPAITRGADGVVVVYNPEVPSHEPELGIWYDRFVKEAGLSDQQCLVYVHRSNPAPAPRTRPPAKLQRVGTVATNFNAAQQVLSSFDDFLGTCAAARKNRH